MTTDISGDSVVSDSTAILERIATETLDGEYTSERRVRLADLSEEADDVTPIELYEAWHGETPTTRDEAARASARRTGDGFDPATDQRNSTRKNDAARTYHEARERGFEELAEYLRSMGLATQAEFARLLDEAFDFETGEWVVEDAPGRDSEEIPRMGGI